MGAGSESPRRSPRARLTDSIFRREMSSEDTAIVVGEMLREFSAFSSTLGGLEFYGHSIEFRDVVQLCRDFASVNGGKGPSSNKAYVFAERFHGKSAIAKATEVEAKSNGLLVFRFDGAAGTTQNELRNLKSRAEALLSSMDYRKRQQIAARSWIVSIP